MTPENLNRKMIPIPVMEALLDRNRFGMGAPKSKVTVSYGELPDIGVVVPLPQDASDLASIYTWSQDYSSLELAFVTQLDKAGIEAFYLGELSQYGYEVRDAPMMRPEPFRVLGEQAQRPLLLCGGPNQPAWWVAFRSAEAAGHVYVRITLDPQGSPCGSTQRAHRPHEEIMARMPVLALPAGSEVRNLGSSANNRDLTQSATVSGDTSVRAIVEAFADSIIEAGLTLVASEVGNALGLVEWNSPDTGDRGLATVVRYVDDNHKYELSMRIRLGGGAGYSPIRGPV